jgi:oligopeptide transport system substrate-binding protein
MTMTSLNTIAMPSPLSSLNRAKHCVVIVAISAALLGGCTGVSADSEFFGRVVPPEGQHLRYISGSEPQSMDPQIGTGQPEARIYLAIFDGLTENHPQTNQPLPSLAESWDVNGDNSEFTFHMRPDARWSDREPITADDMVYSWRRALSPQLAAPNAYMAYHIKYAQAYNEGRVFVRDPQSGEFLLDPAATGESGVAAEGASSPDGDAGELTPFRRFITGPRRLTLPGDTPSRALMFAQDPELESLVAGKEMVPIAAEDLGFEAVDPYTFRVTLNQSVPFFPGLVNHQFLRPVPRQAIQRHGDDWTDPENIVSSGPFHLETYQAYDKIVVVKSPTFWDADTVRLDSITFYPMEDQTTEMNLYKAGAVDAVLNHTVPIGWIETIRPLGDYMDAPENAIEYYIFNTTRPPMDDIRVRKAFNAAVDKQALVAFKRTGKPLTAFSPEGIFPGYEPPVGEPFDPEGARRLLAEAGYVNASGEYDPSTFPVSEVELTYNTNDNNRQVAEFVQAQWRQNLGITVGLKNMEWQAYLEDTRTMAFKGFARRGWVGDYMDPYTFLELFATPTGNNGSGWFEESYVDMLDLANRSLDPEERFRLLAEAERRILEVQPIVPLFTQATNWVKKPYVKGMYPNPNTMFNWKYVYIEHDPALWDREMPSLVPDGTYEFE